MLLDLCYTVSMDTDQNIWRVWARFLHQWGVKEWVASFLEAAGPLAILGAQAVYVGQPFLTRSPDRSNLAALARLLEEPEQMQAFVNFLREPDS